MVWELKDEDLLGRVAATTAPPSSVDTLLGDELWSNVFSMWATDLGYQRGDYKASLLHHLWADLNYGTPGETIRAQYVDPNGPSALPWQTSVQERFERVANGMDSDFGGALAELRNATIEALEPYVSQFRGDILELQSQHVSEPTPVPVKMIRPDMSTVDSINQTTLKDLPEFSKNQGGSTVKFYANSSAVLIGDNHPASYYEYLKATGHTIGTVRMMKRGGAFSPGRVEVGILEVLDPDGRPDVNELGLYMSQDDIRQAVTDAIGRVSNKEVKQIN